MPEEKVTFTISEECFFNNGNLLLPLMKDKAGTDLHDSIKNWLCQEYSLLSQEHSSQSAGTWDGFNANDINTKLRKKIHMVNGIHGETHVAYRGLFHNSKEGFDFSLYDEQCNFIRIRNTCIGNPGIYNGDNILINLYSKIRKSEDDSVKIKKREWIRLVEDIGGTPGENVTEQKKSFTIVGEIQFGNWALAYHDLFRLINSSLENSIDYYIYIAPTGTLAQKISQGVVTYDKITKAIKDNCHRISVPMWVIGLDIQ